MSTSQELSLPKTPSQPHLKAVPHEDNPIFIAFEKYLQAKGVPSGVSEELTDTVEKAAKKVPSWVLYLLMFFGGPFMLFLYGQYESYKDLPQQFKDLQTIVQTQQTQLNRIEDLLSPTSRPK